mgnify:CR=1 FL=1
MVSHMMYLMIFTLICSLNPYCSGRWSRTHDEFNKRVEKYVLILIVVDNSLVPREMEGIHASMASLNPYCSGQWPRTQQTLNRRWFTESLNPYCSGQWPRTRPYKTILIISKLKNFTKQILNFLNRKLTIP